MTEKGEFQADASLTSGPGLSASAAYAVLPHVGVMVNASAQWDRQRGARGTNSELLSPLSIKYRRHCLDAGVGFFIPFDQKRQWVAEVYGGFGRGSLHIGDTGISEQASPYSRSLRSDVSRYFIQPALGFSSKNFQAGVYLRWLFMDFKDIKSTYTNEETAYYDLPVTGSGGVGFVEAGSVFRVYLPPSEKLAIEFATLVSVNRFGARIDYIPLEASIGMHLRLP